MRSLASRAPELAGGRLATVMVAPARWMAGSTIPHTSHAAKSYSDSPVLRDSCARGLRRRYEHVTVFEPATIPVRCAFPVAARGQCARRGVTRGRALGGRAHVRCVRPEPHAQRGRLHATGDE